MDHKQIGLGIPDDCFFREAGVPMTKREIRVLSLASLQLFPGAVFYDIGAGTGSMSIEAKRLVPECCVYAVERDPRALAVLEKNYVQFAVDLHRVSGSAPWVLRDLPPADRIFIGGSGGRLEEILRGAHEKLKPGGKLVLASVTVHSGSQGWCVLEELGCTLEGLQVNAAVTVNKGAAVMWQARNPVTIISAWKEEH